MGSPFSLFCFGLGYTALALVRTLQVKGWEIAGTCRSLEKQRVLLSQGIKTYLFTREHPLEEVATLLSGYRYILHSIPPVEEGDSVLECHGLVLAKVSRLRWFGYLSTTGVYGNTDGAWIDETATPNPTGTRQRRRLYVETKWLDLFERFGLPVHIFRLAGIYGPGRNALEAVRTGKAHRIYKPGHVLSRIHVDDIVTILSASMENPCSGSIYNVCDDEPTASYEVVTYASELLGVVPPPLVPLEKADISPMAASFYRDNRRVSNKKVKRGLNITLKFPTYRHGLKALFSRTCGSS